MSYTAHFDPADTDPFYEQTNWDWPTIYNNRVSNIDHGNRTMRMTLQYCNPNLTIRTNRQETPHRTTPLLSTSRQTSRNEESTWREMYGAVCIHSDSPWEPKSEICRLSKLFSTLTTILSTMGVPRSDLCPTSSDQWFRMDFPFFLMLFCLLHLLCHSHIVQYVNHSLNFVMVLFLHVLNGHTSGNPFAYGVRP